MNLDDYVTISEGILAEITRALPPWEITENIQALIRCLLDRLSSDYSIKDSVAIHKSATVHHSAEIVGPALIGPECWISPFAYLRSGVLLTQKVTVGVSCEIKASVILDNSTVAHLNYIGNSIIGCNVNIEAGAVLANHFNERRDKQIRVRIGDKITETGTRKFGALVADDCRIGANSVTSPGTILEKGSIVGRLQLVDQLRDENRLSPASMSCH